MLSSGEEDFALQCRIYSILPEREYKFHPKRKWRFDFALPDRMVAIEIEGGVWSGGRHTRGSGYIKDLEKYNQAALMGWAILRFTSDQVISGEAIDTVLQYLNDGVKLGSQGASTPGKPTR